MKAAFASKVYIFGDGRVCGGVGEDGHVDGQPGRMKQIAAAHASLA